MKENMRKEAFERFQFKKNLVHLIPGPRFNIKMSSYQYRKSHCGDKTILRPSYLHNGISYTGKTLSLYWIGAQVLIDENISLLIRTGLPTVTEFQYFVKEMRPWVRKFFWILAQNTEIFGDFSMIITWKYWNLGKCYWKSWNYSKLLLE